MGKQGVTSELNAPRAKLPRDGGGPGLTALSGTVKKLLMSKISGPQDGQVTVLKQGDAQEEDNGAVVTGTRRRGWRSWVWLDRAVGEEKSEKIKRCTSAACEVHWLLNSLLPIKTTIMGQKLDKATEDERVDGRVTPEEPDLCPHPWKPGEAAGGGVASGEDPGQEGAGRGGEEPEKFACADLETVLNTCGAGSCPVGREAGVGGDSGGTAAALPVRRPETSRSTERRRWNGGSIGAVHQERPTSGEYETNPDTEMEQIRRAFNKQQDEDRDHESGSGKSAKGISARTADRPSICGTLMRLFVSCHILLRELSPSLPMNQDFLVLW
ncbi:uncharacterized protein LOC108932570 isoform X1 [Arapaima gigas]